MGAEGFKKRPGWKLKQDAIQGEDEESSRMCAIIHHACFKEKIGIASHEYMFTQP